MTDNGDDETMFEHAYLLEIGEYGVKMNKHEAARYYKMSANLGNTKSMNNYGIMLKDGLEIPRKITEGLRYIEKSANKNNPEGMLNYGGILVDGKIINKETEK